MKISLACLAVIMCLSGCNQAGPGEKPDDFMGALVLSKSGIKDVQAFKDTSYIHGLKFFRFRASQTDMDRLIIWMDLKKHDHIPDVLAGATSSGIAKADWQFDSKTAQVYVTYHCHPFNGSNVSIDMLLIRNGDAIYVTEGFDSASSVKAADPAACNGQDKN